MHLLDGGIADNLALRGLLNLFISLQSNAELFNRTALGTRRVLVISIDGEAETPHELAHERKMGGLFETLAAASGTQIDAYNFETLALTRVHVEHMAERIRNIRCAQARIVYGHPCDDVRADLVHIALSDITDPAVHARLAEIPTGLTIPRRDVDALVQYGEKLVRDNPVIRSVAAEADFVPLNAPPPAPDVASR